MMYDTYKCFKTVADTVKHHNLKFELPHYWVVNKALSEVHNFMTNFSKFFTSNPSVTQLIVTSKQRAINENRPYLHSYIDKHGKIFA